MAQPHIATLESCSPCHPAQTKNYHLSGMANALKPADKSAILRANPVLHFSEDEYSTAISRDDQGSALVVTDGKETLTARIVWAFGRGNAGQTYIFQHIGELFESRVSYYGAIKGLSLTLGAQGARPRSLVEAAGRRMDAADVRQCFGCHSTGAVRNNQVVWESMVPGVLCENCHGDATLHSKARRNGNRSAAAMRPLTALTAEEMNDLCGTCHRTWAQVLKMKVRGPLNVRFQPYRITNSKCFDADDARIACTACHDPHSELVSSPGAYDVACLACHTIRGSGKKSDRKSRRVCTVGKDKCVTCHMPKITLPSAHYAFADHQIRIAKPGGSYPN